MKKTLAVLFTTLALVTACGDSGSSSGTVVEKDYDAAYTEKVTKKTCTGTIAQKNTCKKNNKKKGKYHPADWDLTIRDSSGEEHEIDVSKSVYEKYNVGDRYTR